MRLLKGCDKGLLLLVLAVTWYGAGVTWAKNATTTPPPAPKPTPTPTKSTLTPTPTPTPKTTPKSTPTPTPTPKTTPKSTPTPTPKATPNATVNTSTARSPKATPTITPKATPTITPKATPNTTTKATARPNAKATTRPNAKATTRPNAKATPRATRKPTMNTTTQATSKPTVKSTLLSTNATSKPSPASPKLSSNPTPAGLNTTTTFTLRSMGNLTTNAVNTTATPDIRHGSSKPMMILDVHPETAEPGTTVEISLEVWETGSFKYYIDAGDGTPVKRGIYNEEGVLVDHTYRNPGTYTIRAWVNIHFKIYHASHKQITITAPPALDMDLSVVPDSILEGTSALITLTVSESGSFPWFLNFGDGSSVVHGIYDGEVERSHQYNSPGTYTVSAWIFLHYELYHAEDVEIEVLPLPHQILVLSVDPHTVEVDEDTFITLEVSEPGTFLWFIDFGDGSTDAEGDHSGDVERIHRYNSAGTYTVSAWAIINSTKYHADDVHIEVTAPPDIQLSVDPHSLVAGTRARITLQVSEAEPFSWFIDFGDGSTHLEEAHSGDVERSHRYNSAGTYTVSAWVIIDSIKYHADDVHIEVTVPPELHLIVDPHSIAAGTSAVITLEVSYPGSFFWSIEFGDGSTDEDGPHSGEVEVSHQYNDPDTYTVKAWIIIGSNTYHAEDVLVHVFAPSPPDIQLSVDPHSLVAGTRAHITLQVSEAEPFSWFIDFGDGSTDLEEAHSGDVERSHRYNSAGTYTVSAWVIIDSIKYHADDVHIEVTVPPELHLIVDPHSIAAGTSAVITLEVSYPGSFFWSIEFGDGSTDEDGPHSGEVEVSHQYNDPDTYTVKAWIIIGSNTYHAEDVLVHVFAPSPPPGPPVTIFIDLVPVVGGVMVSLKIKVTSDESYPWPWVVDFDDGTPTESGEIIDCPDVILLQHRYLIDYHNCVIVVSVTLGSVTYSYEYPLSDYPPHAFGLSVPWEESDTQAEATPSTSPAFSFTLTVNTIGDDTYTDEAVDFRLTATSSGNAIYVIDFGDGSYHVRDNENGPVDVTEEHIYSQPGTYTVTASMSVDNIILLRTATVEVLPGGGGKQLVVSRGNPNSEPVNVYVTAYFVDTIVGEPVFFAIELVLRKEDETPLMINYGDDTDYYAVLAEGVTCLVVHHVYDSPGVYVVVVTIQAHVNRKDALYTRQIRVWVTEADGECEDDDNNGAHDNEVLETLADHLSFYIAILVLILVLVLGMLMLAVLTGLTNTALTAASNAGTN